MTTNSSDDERLALRLAALLSAGVAVSAAVLVVGVVLIFALGPSSPWGRQLVLVGCGALVATPILRVVTTFVTLLFRRDWRFAALNAVVLALVVAGLLLGRVVE